MDTTNTTERHGHASTDARPHAITPAHEFQALLRAARRWAAFALETADLSPVATREAIRASVRFSLWLGAGHLAVPFRLDGTASRQLTLRAVEHIGVPPLGRLFWKGSPRRPKVCFGDQSIGIVPAAHRPWVERLLPHGLRFRMVRIERDARSSRLGCTAAAWPVDRALQRYQQEL